MALLALIAVTAIWGVTFVQVKGVALSVAGLAMLSGIHAGSATGDALVLAASGIYSLQIVLLGRVAPRLDPVALTFVEMLAACAAFSAIAAARSDLEALTAGPCGAPCS